MNKPLTPLTSRQMAMIVGNIRKVMTTGNSKNLTKQAYSFLNLSAGFIAHYNVYGFQDYYENVDNLAREILSNQPINQWKNFRPGERDYQYQMAKNQCYNAICDVLVKLGYQPVRSSSYSW